MREVSGSGLCKAARTRVSVREISMVGRLSAHVSELWFSGSVACSKWFMHWILEIFYCNPKGSRALLRIPSTRRAKCLPMLGSLKT